MPEDRKDWKLVPVDPRPFPDQLRDRPMEHAALSDAAGGTLGMRGLMIVLAAPVALWHRGVKAGRAAAP